MDVYTLNAIHQLDLDKLERLLLDIVKKNNNSLLLHNVCADLYLDTEEGRIVKEAHIEEIYLADELYFRYNFGNESFVDEVYTLSYDELYNILYGILKL